ncbi:MAG: DUF427 domain-containing protein [Actinobacteria bacterium]|nr:DUF427 domain-containing protein [Actinomycetota bacterium]
MPKAIWNDTVVAESDDTVVVEGNQYFPKDAVQEEFLQPTDHHTYCGWKGTANYYDVVVDGEVADKGAWYYPKPMEGAEQVADRIAFWRGVKVSP